MKDFPLFTVIIPQKNRAEYMCHTLRTCMIQDYPNFEVIVSDDCSDDDSVAVIKDLAKRDNRIKLFAHDNHLGMRDNFEFALNQVKSGYVMALGGDDGLTPGCIWRMYEIIKETGTELLTWTPAGFTYPTDGSQNNIFRVPRRKGTLIKIQSTLFLQKIAKTFRYQIDECPMFYMKGVASIDLVNRVKSRTKDHSFYYCPTPDGFSGVVLAGEVEEYVMSYEPLSITGTTSKSQGQNYRRNDAKSKFESQQFFNDNIRRTMHEQLASQQYSPLVTLMTADYLLTAKDLPGWPAKDAFEISFEELLKESFRLIKNSYFSNETLLRELIILKKIAEQHNLLSLYDELYQKTKKKVNKYEMPHGFYLTHTVHLNGAEIGIKDIFDACIAVPFVYNFVGQFRLKRYWELFINSVRFVFYLKCNTFEDLPPRGEIDK